MVKRKLSVKQLEKAIEKAQKKAKTAEEKIRLGRELKQLEEGTNIKLLRRFGKGFVVLAKKTGKATGRGIVKARKFAEESGAGRGFDVELSSSIPRGQPRDQRRVVRARPIRRRGRRVIIQRVKAKPIRRSRARRPKRKVKRGGFRQPAQDTGFFGGLSDLGI